MKAYVRLLGLWVLLLTFVGTARATDVTVAATTIPNFNPSNAGAAVTIANVTVTNGSPTVSCSACLRPTWVGMSGFTITLGSTNYTVSYVTSTSSLTLTANYAGTTGTVTATWHPYVEWRFYADRAFQPLGASYIVQPGTPGTGSWYKRYAASILTVSGVKTLYLPEITIDATTDSPGPTNQARYMAAFYRPDNSLIQFYACFEQFRVPATTPTTWTALCAYNSPPAIVPPAQEAYTKTQIDARFPSCTIGQMLYYAATGNVQSCLTVGSGLNISGGTITASASGADVRQAVNASDYGCDLTDSVTDDATCLANAVTAAMGAKNKILYLPGGTYNTNSGTVTFPGGLIVVGDGKGKTIIKSTYDGVIVDAVEGTGSYIFRGPVIRDLGIQGDVTKTSQIGLQMTDANYYFGSEVSGVNITDIGQHGLSIGNVYSSTWRDIYISNVDKFPLLYNSANMPGNYFENIYVGDLVAADVNYNAAGFRIKAGDFACKSCNGVNNVITASKWAVVGKKSGTDGDVANGSASFTCIDCNLETWVANGILAYYGSYINVLGNTTFAVDVSGTGTGKPIEFEHINNGSDYYAEFIRRGYIDDSVVFQQARATYANNQPIHANGFAPIQVRGRGPAVAGEATLVTFYNSTAAATAYLSRADGNVAKITVTGSQSFTDPTVRYIEANCAAACTITLPWPGWYRDSQEVLVIKDISGTASTNNITITANSGGTVNGSSYVLRTNNGSVSLAANNTATDWRVISSYGPNAAIDVRQAVNAADYGCTLADSAADDTACLAAAIAAAKTTTNKMLYLPGGTYNTDAITASLGGLVIVGDGPTKSIIKAISTNHNVISLTSAGSASNLVIRDLGIHGQGKAAGNTGHCIYINDNVSYLSQFEFNNLEIKNCRQNGIYVPYIFNGVIRRVTTDEIGGNHFDLGAANTVTLEGNYIQTIEARKVGFRLRGGAYTLIGNNGIEPDSSSVAFWGMFGSKAIATTGDVSTGSFFVTSVGSIGSFQIGDEITITGAGPGGTDLTTYVTFINTGINLLTLADAASADITGATITATDGVDSYFNGALIGNNIESFGYYGIRLKENSKLGTVSGNSFQTDLNAIAHIALKLDYAGGSVPAGTWDQTNTLTLNAGTWANSAAIHSQGAPLFVVGGNPSQYYETSFPALVDLPQVVASWDGGFNEMFAKTPNLQGDNVKVGTASTTTGQLLFQNAANSNRFILQAGTTGANLTYTLPTAYGTAGYCLSDNGSGTLSWVSCGGTPSLTATYVGYGSGTNTLTGSSRFTWDNTNYKLSLSNSSTLGLILQAGGGTTAAHPGTGYGLIMPYVGGGQSSGPGIWWTDGNYNALVGMWLNLGLNIQGTGGVANVKIRKATDTSSDGDIVFDLRPNDGRFDMYPYGVSSGNTTQIAFRELAANGTNYVSIKGPNSIASDITWTLPATDSTGTQCLASNGSGTLSWTACSGGGGTPGGSAKQVQFNSSGNFGGATGFEYQQLASPNVSITAQAATYVPLYVNGAVGQSESLQQWAVNSTVYTEMDSLGALYLGRGIASATPATGKVLATGGTGTNITGGTLALYGGNNTGSGLGGSIVFYTTVPGSTGSTPGTPTIRYEVDTYGNHFFGDAALATNATNGFVAIPTTAGVPNGTPANSVTGLGEMILDSTNYRIYAWLGGAWRNLSGGSGITIGTTAITSGTAGRILYETSGNVVGEIAGSSADANGAVQFAASARSSGVAQYFRINTPADTGLTASTESVGAYFGGNGSGSTVTRTWAAGALTTQRENVFVAPTYAFASASTITTAATVAITGAPVAGANATITNSRALWANGSVVIGDPTATIQTFALLPNAGGYAGLWFGSTAVASPTTSNYSFMHFSDGTYIGYRGSLYIRNHNGAAWAAAFDANGLLGVGIGVTTPSAQVHFASGSASRVGLRVDSAANSTVALAQYYLNADDTSTPALHSVFAANSNGTAAAGFGGQLAFQAESSTTNSQDAAAINWLWTDATHATRTAALTISTVSNAGSLAERWRIAGNASSTAPSVQQTITMPNGGTNAMGAVSELLTLSTGGTTTDTTIDLPANSIILSVTGRITTTITTATDWKLGDATVADRFSDANATLTAGTTVVGINQWKADRTTAGQGAFQQSTAKVRVTTTGTPGAGAIRITVHYISIAAPTS